ncbi:uncharacterized protein LOC122013571 [Zingiber officinale]|uniref:uncharacterized protein LOC122013571 n=1 Tax=Zingiber officinale TaxID=94328 RepID=UPI001C4D8171|nr:uncharacterized protein LOC122013571 [Zingiber officinale]
MEEAEHALREMHQGCCGSHAGGRTLAHKGLKVKLDHVEGDWVEELQSILWTYRTTPQESTGLTLFHLVYDNEAVVPIEVEVPSIRRILYDEENAERRLPELDLISETRERTVARLAAYRQRMR